MTATTVARYGELLSSISGPNVSKLTEQKIASLWAGYGTVSRLHVQFADGANKRFIVKRVTPRPEKGIGHNRKVHSYQVEAHFYSHYVKQCIAQTGLGVPEPIAITAEEDTRFEFLLSDLSDAFPNSSGDYTLEEAQAAICWLATFHAFFWEQSCDGLWAEGCYWHLETRQEELAQIGREWQQLKDLAGSIDAALQGGQSGRHRTLVHGDFKAANVVFNNDGTVCAAYDFQYCGGGFGAKDLVYMFCSSLDSDVLEEAEEQLLRCYHSQLRSSFLKVHGKELEYSYELFTKHYHLCVLDYVRFMAGWGFWGNVRWSKKKARELLKDVDKLLKE